jgi:hypothetical protein
MDESRDRKSDTTRTRRITRRRVAWATAWLGAAALLVGPGVSWALDVTGTLDSTTTTVSGTVDSATTTVQQTTQQVATTVDTTTQAVVQTTQTAVQDTQTAVQNTVSQTQSTVGAVTGTPTQTSPTTSTHTSTGSGTTSTRHTTRLRKALSNLTSRATTLKSATSSAGQLVTHSVTARRVRHTRATSTAGVASAPVCTGAPSALGALVGALLGTMTSDSACATTARQTALSTALPLPICDPGPLDSLLAPVESVLSLVCSTARNYLGIVLPPAPAHGAGDPGSTGSGSGAGPQRAASAPSGATAVRGRRVTHGASTDPRSLAVRERAPRAGGGVRPAAYGGALRGGYGAAFGAGSASRASGRGELPIGEFPSRHHGKSGPLAFLSGHGGGADALIALVILSWIILAALGVGRLTLRVLPRSS